MIVGKLPLNRIHEQFTNESNWQLKQRAHLLCVCGAVHSALLYVNSQS